MLHFYPKNASAICQRTYTVGVKTWVHSILKHWCLSTFKMLADSCRACSQLIPVLSGPLDDVIQVDELDAICIHMVLELCFFGENPTYYASIIPRLKNC